MSNRRYRLSLTLLASSGACCGSFVASAHGLKFHLSRYAHMNCASFPRFAAIGFVAICSLNPGALPGSSARAQETVDQRSPGSEPAAVSTAAAKADPGMKEFLDGLLDAVRESDSERVSAYIDTERMFKEIERQKIASISTPAEQTALRVALKTVIGDGLLKEGAAGSWRSYRLHRLDTRAEAPTVIDVHMLSKEGRSVGLVQFWLTREGQREWKIYDWQEASSIFKTSTLMAVTVSAFRNDPSAARSARLFAAAQAASAGDMAASERIVLELVNERLPAALDGPRWLLYAQIKFHHGQPDKALECLDQAARFDPRMLGLAKIKALLHAELQNPTRSLEFAREALAALGDDAEVYAMIGKALAQLGKPDEAASAYRKGLAADPNFVPNLVGLAGALPAGKKNEIADRLGHCARPSETFPALAEALATGENSEALEVITAAGAKLHVDKPSLDYYRGRLAALTGKADEAETLFKEAVADADSAEARQFYTERLLDAELKAGHTLEAFQESDNPTFSFRYLAEPLSQAQHADALLALAEAYVTRLPKNPDGYFYEGRARIYKEQYDQAARAFSRGIALVKPGAPREPFRNNLVYALYKSGKGLAAYDEVGLPADTARQLASLFLADRQGEPLQKLVAAHRKVEPGDQRLDVWEADALMLQKDYAGAARVLKTAIDKAVAPAQKRTLVNKFLDAHLANKTPADGYVQTPDPSYSFGYVCERLLKDQDVAGLKAVINVQRLRKAARDPRLPYYAGQSHMLSGDYRAAEQEFARGLGYAGDRGVAALLQTGRLRALCKLGEAQKAYDEADDKPLFYRLLGPILIEQNRPADLAALVTAYRGFTPKEPTLGLWEAESKWLAGDLDGTINVLRRDRDQIMADPANATRFDDHLVRSLIRLKRFSEAAQAARESTERDGDPWFEAVVAVASGDATRATPLLQACAGRGYRLAQLESDPDAAPALKAPAFQELRNKLSATN
jgi:tetratricopeptide (TPR) repeat protein